VFRVVNLFFLQKLVTNQDLRPCVKWQLVSFNLICLCVCLQLNLTYFKKDFGQELEPKVRYGMFFGIFVGSLGLILQNNLNSQLAKAHMIEILADLNKMKTKYLEILESLDQAVISQSSDGFRYFNIQGNQVLLECAQKLEETEMQLGMAEIECLKSKIKDKNYKWSSDEASQNI
jgi:hypothetical protein